MPEPTHRGDRFSLFLGDVKNVLPTLADASIDAVVTDPPYGLKFMGKQWDYDVPTAAVWREVLRILKPGGHLLSFFGTRTYHRGVVAVEDAGFEVRDQLGWMYGSGFPKSLDVSKAADKRRGAKRRKVGTKKAGMGTGKTFGMLQAEGQNAEAEKVVPVTMAATAEAAMLEGYGTALKPAWEPIVLARRPHTGSVLSNVMEHGTGALNVGGTRVGKEKHRRTCSIGGVASENVAMAGPNTKRMDNGFVEGRWPANVLHDGSEDVLAVLGKYHRFFYCAKASAQERDASLGMLPREAAGAMEWNHDGSLTGGKIVKRHNVHPTVKPLAVMYWLVRLVTPPGGKVLDPYMGSGTTGMAAIGLGYDFVGIDNDNKYMGIAHQRILAAGG
jgi:DNA methylase